MPDSDTIKPPKNGGPGRDDTPDPETKEGLDYTGEEGVPGRFFHFKRWGLNYGDDDKVHATAFILSIALLCVIFVLSIFNFRESIQEVNLEIVKMLGSALLLTIGIAVGRGRYK